MSGFNFLAKKLRQILWNSYIFLLQNLVPYRQRYGTKLCNELGMDGIYKKYNKEYYLKNREEFCQKKKKSAMQKRKHNKSWW